MKKKRCCFSSPWRKLCLTTTGTVVSCGWTLRLLRWAWPTRCTNNCGLLKHCRLDRGVCRFWGTRRLCPTTALTWSTTNWLVGTGPYVHSAKEAAPWCCWAITNSSKPRSTWNKSLDDPMTDTWTSLADTVSRLTINNRIDYTFFLLFFTAVFYSLIFYARLKVLNFSKSLIYFISTFFISNIYACPRNILYTLNILKPCRNFFFWHTKRRHNINY